ncbi:hypothetical protein GCM10027417_16200 [Glutamicibacter endophyticus]
MNAHPKSPVPRRAPRWLAPLLAAVLVIALCWILAVTLLRPLLVQRGLPEGARGVSNEQQQVWQYSARLADLEDRAEQLADLSEGDTKLALRGLQETLGTSVALLGELSFEDEPQPALAQDYSEQAAAQLAVDAATASAEVPEAPDNAPQVRKVLTHSAVALNLQARAVIAELPKKQRPKGLTAPLAATGGAADAAPVACLAADEGVTTPGHGQDAVRDVAYALDRGYALDYIWQLTAARSGSKAAESREQRRDRLATQLAALRAVRAPDCSDVRAPAYRLPENSLDKLPEVGNAAQRDFAFAVLDAATSTSGAKRAELAKLGVDLFESLAEDKVPFDLLREAK